MEDRAQVLRDLIATVKGYVTVERQEDMQAAALQANFDKLVAEDAELAPLVQELKAQLELLKNAAPVAPVTPVVEPVVELERTYVLTTYEPLVDCIQFIPVPERQSDDPEIE